MVSACWSSRKTVVDISDPNILRLRGFRLNIIKRFRDPGACINVTDDRYDVLDDDRIREEARRLGVGGT